MMFHSIRVRAAAVSFVASALALAATASARQVQLQFTGTYNTNGKTVFGLTGVDVPFSYTIDYDTPLDTNNVFAPAGSPVGGTVAADNFYGYSKSGIVASSLTFGSATFTTGELRERSLASGFSADFFLNADLATSIPTAAVLYYSNTSTNRELSLGGITVNSTGLTYIPESYIGAGSSRADSTTFTVTATPEPASFGLLALAGVGMLRRRRRA